MKKIVFVCSGNTCRSPLAEAIARQVLPGRVSFELSIASAGTSAQEGNPASRNSVEIAERHGLDLSKHQSRMLSRELLHDADLIVTMGVRHREAVEEIDPDSAESTFLLTNFSAVYNGDVPDPIGSDLAIYERTYLVIRECIEAMAQKLHHFDGWKKTGKRGH
jgi:protein-tyrosine-phosphatase